MEKTYHILKVYDYKGGELCTNLNLSYEDLIEDLVETFHLYDYVYDTDLEGDYETDEERDAAIPQILRDALASGDLQTWIDNQSSIYAGGGDICISLYECENNTMEEIEISDELLTKVVEFYLTTL